MVQPPLMVLLPLHAAVTRADVKATLRELDNGADIDEYDENNWTVLVRARRYTHHPQTTNASNLHMRLSERLHHYYHPAASSDLASLPVT